MGKWEQSDKGHHAIYNWIGWFYSKTFLCSIFWILSLKRSKHSNTAVTCCNRAVKNVSLAIPSCSYGPALKA